MSLTITVIPGKTFAATESVTIAKLNQLGQPTITATGNIAQLSDWHSVVPVAKTFTYAGSGDQITVTAHGLTAPTTVDNVVRARVSTSGTLPAGLAASSTFSYYVRVADANTLTLHETAAGALNNTDRIAITAAGTGTHTISWTVYALGVAVIYNAATAMFELGIVDHISLPEMIGASVSANGARGAVPQPAAGDAANYLRGDGTWADPVGSGTVGNYLYMNNTLV